MSRSDRRDWRNWLALAWAAWFGVLYVGTVIEARTPGLARTMARWLAPGK